MKRRGFFVLIGGASVGMMLTSAPRLTAETANTPLSQATPWARALIDAAVAQIGITTGYDPSYRGLDFPMGDVPRQVGVCTDVVVRAYRDAFNIDLQALIHADMKRAFDQYPTIWGLRRTDANIDHRRVPNIERFLQRAGADMPPSTDPQDYRAGDLVTQRLPGNLPHIGIVTDQASADGKRPMMVHNIGRGTHHEDRVFEFQIVGHFRAAPEILNAFV
ncbi:MAG: DUF1287 domain-containing protein [Pseudomonadota bacterium]